MLDLGHGTGSGALSPQLRGSKERLLPPKFRLGTAHGLVAILAPLTAPLRGTVWARPMLPGRKPTSSVPSTYPGTYSELAWPSLSSPRRAGSHASNDRHGSGLVVSIEERSENPSLFTKLCTDVA